jgi:hypothetical protein
MISNRKLKQLEARLGKGKRKPVDFEDYRKRIGLNVDSLEKIEDLADPLQIALIDLLSKQLALLDDALESCNRGERDYPESLVRGVKPLLDAVARVTAFDVQIDVNKAIQAIQKEGFEVIDPNLLEVDLNEARN